MKYKILGLAFITAALLILGITCLAQEIEPTSLPKAQNPVSPDAAGIAQLPEAGLMDYIFPSSINGKKVTTIGAAAFSGYDQFRSVTIPEEITEIGADAFSDCSNLEHIILKGRTDTSGMSLGKNWSGDAEVMFEYMIAEDEPAVSEEEKDGFDREEPTEAAGGNTQIDTNSSPEQSGNSDHIEGLPAQEHNDTSAGSPAVSEDLNSEPAETDIDTPDDFLLSENAASGNSPTGNATNEPQEGELNKDGHPTENHLP